jgi:drug/metabolite transporter (DMT)-like permease
VVAYLTGVMAVRTLSPQVAAVVGGTEAVIATVLAWILLAEHLGLAQITGGVLVVAGALVAQTASAARSASAEGAVVAGGPTRKADASV